MYQNKLFLRKKINLLHFTLVIFNVTDMLHWGVIGKNEIKYNLDVASIFEQNYMAKVQNVNQLG